MRYLITNCPNCGGELDKDGTCPYCNTKVRMANALDIEQSGFGRELVEIEINVKHGNTTTIYPFVGYLNEMTVEHSMYAETLVNLNFSGTFRSDLNAVNRAVKGVHV